LHHRRIPRQPTEEGPCVFVPVPWLLLVVRCVALAPRISLSASLASHHGGSSCPSDRRHVSRGDGCSCDSYSCERRQHPHQDQGAEAHPRGHGLEARGGADGARVLQGRRGSRQLPVAVGLYAHVRGARRRGELHAALLSRHVQAPPGRAGRHHGAGRAAAASCAAAIGALDRPLAQPPRAVAHVQAVSTGRVRDGSRRAARWCMGSRALQVHLYRLRPRRQQRLVVRRVLQHGAPHPTRAWGLDRARRGREGGHTVGQALLRYGMSL